MRRLSPTDHPAAPAKAPAGRGPAAVAQEPRRVRGRDGRTTEIPRGFVATEGSDGRIVAVPSGAGSLQGSDGRVVVIPPGHIGIENAKGRIVPKLRW